MRTSYLRPGRLVAAVAAAAVPVALFAAAPAEAFTPVNPAGSNYPLFVEPNGPTGDPANALASGFWGHEGPGGAPAPSVVSADLSDGGQAFLDAFGMDNFDNLALVFAPSGQERPTITAGEKVGQAYPWFTGAGFFGAFSGSSNINADGVITVNNQTGFDAWVAAGKPDQGVDANLVMHDVLLPGSPASGAHAQGTSILNTWATGQHISMILVEISGYDTNGEAILAAPKADGKANAAWSGFTTVATPGRAVATSGGYVMDAPAAMATTTTLTATPAGTAVQGQSVTLSAHVAPASGPAVTGTVEFFDGATSLGAPAAVNASGDATLSTSFSTVGTHSLTAKFVATGSFSDSTSSALSYSVTASPATPTSTSVSATPSSSNAFTPVDLSATVAPAAAGTVQFKDGTGNVGTPRTVNPATGVATLTTSQLGAGDHVITAVFTPADPALFAPSTSPAAPTFTLTAATVGDDAIANIQTDVAAGTITIDTPYTSANPLVVPTLQVNAANTMYHGEAAFNDIVVTDTRAGAQPWTVTALASNLTSGANAINGQNVGLINLAATSNTGASNITVTNNPSADGVAPGDGGTLGLGGTPKTVLHAVAGPGTATYHGLLTINAPTTTVAGTYAGTVTFTVS